MTPHTQAQGFQPLKKQKGVEGTLTRTDVAQALRARLHQETVLAEGLEKPHPVIARRGIDHARIFSVRPVEAARIHDDAADARAVPADEFGGRMKDDVRPPLDGAAEVGGGEGVVHHEGNARLVSDFRQRLQIGDVRARVPYRLAVDGPCFFRNGGIEILRIRRIDEDRIDSDFSERDVELRVGASVEGGGRYDFIARRHQGEQRDELRGLARRRRQRAGASLQSGDALLECARGGVSDTRVDVPIILQGEKARRMFVVVEDERRGLIDGHRPRAGGGVGTRARMEGVRFEMKRSRGSSLGRGILAHAHSSKP